MVTLSKLIKTIVFTFSQNNLLIPYELAVMLILSFIQVYSLYTIKPYYDKILQTWVCFLNSIYLWTCINLVFSQALLSSNLNNTYIIYIFILGIPFVCMFYINDYHKNITNQTHLYMNITEKSSELEIIQSFFSIQYLVSKKNSNDRLAAFNLYCFIYNHEKTCINNNCPLKEFSLVIDSLIMSKNIKLKINSDEGYNSDYDEISELNNELHSTLSKFDSKKEVTNFTTDVINSSNSKMSSTNNVENTNNIDIENEAFDFDNNNRIIKKNNNEDSFIYNFLKNFLYKEVINRPSFTYLLLIYAVFIYEKLSLRSQALIIFNSIYNNDRLSLEEKFLVHKYLKKINEESENTGDNVKSEALDFISKIEYSSNFKLFFSYILECSFLFEKFWQLVLNGNIEDYNMKDNDRIVDISNRIVSTKFKINLHWNKLQNLNVNDYKAFYYYYIFNRIILNKNETANRYLDIYNNHNEENKFSFKGNFNYEFSDAIEQELKKGTDMIICEANLDDMMSFTNIKYISSGISRYLGYEDYEIVNKPLSTILISTYEKNIKTIILEYILLIHNKNYLNQLSQSDDEYSQELSDLVDSSKIKNALSNNGFIVFAKNKFEKIVELEMFLHCSYKNFEEKVFFILIKPIVSAKDLVDNIKVAYFVVDEKLNVDSSFYTYRNVEYLNLMNKSHKLKYNMREIVPDTELLHFNRSNAMKSTKKNERRGSKLPSIKNRSNSVENHNNNTILNSLSNYTGIKTPNKIINNTDKTISNYYEKFKGAIFNELKTLKLTFEFPTMIGFSLDNNLNKETSSIFDKRQSKRISSNQLLDIRKILKRDSDANLNLGSFSDTDILMQLEIGELMINADKFSIVLFNGFNKNIKNLVEELISNKVDIRKEIFQNKTKLEKLLIHNSVAKSKKDNTKFSNMIDFFTNSYNSENRLYIVKISYLNMKELPKIQNKAKLIKKEPVIKYDTTNVLTLDVKKLILEKIKNEGKRKQMKTNIFTAINALKDKNILETKYDDFVELNSISSSDDSSRDSNSDSDNDYEKDNINDFNENRTNNQNFNANHNNLNLISNLENKKAKDQDKKKDNFEINLVLIRENSDEINVTSKENKKGSKNNKSIYDISDSNKMLYKIFDMFTKIEIPQRPKSCMNFTINIAPKLSKKINFLNSLKKFNLSNSSSSDNYSSKKYDSDKTDENDDIESDSFFKRIDMLNQIKNQEENIDFEETDMIKNNLKKKNKNRKLNNNDNNENHRYNNYKDNKDEEVELSKELRKFTKSISTILPTKSISDKIKQFEPSKFYKNHVRFSVNNNLKEISKLKPIHKDSILVNKPLTNSKRNQIDKEINSVQFMNIVRSKNYNKSQIIELSTKLKNYGKNVKICYEYIDYRKKSDNQEEVVDNCLPQIYSSINLETHSRHVSKSQEVEKLSNDVNVFKSIFSTLNINNIDRNIHTEEEVNKKKTKSSNMKNLDLFSFIIWIVFISCILIEYFINTNHKQNIHSITNVHKAFNDISYSLINNCHILQALINMNIQSKLPSQKQEIYSVNIDLFFKRYTEEFKKERNMIKDSINRIESHSIDGIFDILNNSSLIMMNFDYTNANNGKNDRKSILQNDINSSDIEDLNIEENVNELINNKRKLGYIDRISSLSNASLESLLDEFMLPKNKINLDTNLATKKQRNAIYREQNAYFQNESLLSSINSEYERILLLDSFKLNSFDIQNNIISSFFYNSYNSIIPSIIVYQNNIQDVLDDLIHKNMIFNLYYSAICFILLLVMFTYLYLRLMRIEYERQVILDSFFFLPKYYVNWLYIRCSKVFSSFNLIKSEKLNFKGLENNISEMESNEDLIEIKQNYLLLNKKNKNDMANSSVNKLWEYTKTRIDSNSLANKLLILAFYFSLIIYFFIQVTLIITYGFKYIILFEAKTKLHYMLIKPYTYFVINNQKYYEYEGFTNIYNNTNTFDDISSQNSILEYLKDKESFFTIFNQHPQYFSNNFVKEILDYEYTTLCNNYTDVYNFYFKDSEFIYENDFSFIQTGKNGLTTKSFKQFLIDDKEFVKQLNMNLTFSCLNNMVFGSKINNIHIIFRLKNIIQNLNELQKRVNNDTGDIDFYNYSLNKEYYNYNRLFVIMNKSLVKLIDAFYNDIIDDIAKLDNINLYVLISLISLILLIFIVGWEPYKRNIGDEINENKEMLLGIVENFNCLRNK